MPGVPDTPAARERHLPRGRSRLHVREIGSGPTIIVLHGGPDFDHEYLLPELDLLASRFRLVYYDQRGRGRSFSGERADEVTLDGEMADLDAVRESAGVASSVVLGHSFGTLLALEYAIRFPDRVTHLVLLSPAPASHEGMVAFRRELAARRSPAATTRMRELATDPRYARGEVEPEAEYYRIHFGTTLGPGDRLEEVVRRLRRAFTAEGIVAARGIESRLYAQTWDRDEYDLTPALERLPMPALVVRGDRDFIPPEVATGIARAIPGGRLAALDGGHFPFVERPEEVASLVAEFLREPPAATR